MTSSHIIMFAVSVIVINSDCCAKYENRPPSRGPLAAFPVRVSTMRAQRLIPAADDRL